MDSLTFTFRDSFPYPSHRLPYLYSSSSRHTANPPSIRSSNSPRNNHDFWPNPSPWVLYPVLGKILQLASSQSRRWSHESLSSGSNNYVQNGSLGLALLSITSTARVKFSPFLATLAANPTFMSGLWAWFAAQSIKICLNFFVERKWDFRILFASGGMPSSHSALCTALTTSVALSHGVADSLFPVCLGFTLIVMYDAIGVRRHAGMQAEVLNKIVEDLFQGHPISERKLKELLGHTPSQVFAGALLGIMVACICCQGCLVVT